MLNRPNEAAPRPAAISLWLLFVAALVFAMVVVGGITRLTESGLSIVRWEPVRGIVPPIGETEWRAAFDAYRTSPQYQLVNRGMTLAEFQNIYFWEYVHRLLARVIGLVFALPLLWFWWRRAIPAGMGRRLVVLLALGGLQGVIGWWMVASGLIDRPDVSHIRLAIHLLTALFIFSLLIWTALDMRRLADAPGAARARMPTLAIWTLCALSLQLLFGAYVAGLDAGYAFNTWPKMGDEWFPSNVPMEGSLLSNFADNPVVVQFIHRWLAFVVAAFVISLGIKAWRAGRHGPATAVVTAVAIQIMLGILTLLTGVDIEIAVAHQAMAAMLVASVVTAAHAIGSGPRPVPAGAPRPAEASEAAAA